MVGGGKRTLDVFFPTVEQQWSRCRGYDMYYENRRPKILPVDSVSYIGGKTDGWYYEKS